MKLSFDKEEGFLITAEFKGSVKDYANMWLVLTNNARENKKVFYRIDNNSENDIYVLTPDDGNNKEAVVEYLQRIGLTIKSVYPVTLVCPYVAEYESEEECGYEIVDFRE